MNTEAGGAQDLVEVRKLAVSCLGAGTVAANTWGMLLALHGTCCAAGVWHLLPGKTGYNRITLQLLCTSMKKNMFFIFTCLQ